MEWKRVGRHCAVIWIAALILALGCTENEDDSQPFYRSAEIDGMAPPPADKNYNIKCLFSDDQPDIPAATLKRFSTTINGKPAIYIRLALDPDFVDNTFGHNSIGWDNRKGDEHKLRELVDGDHAELKLFNALGMLSLRFKLDYISEKEGDYFTNGVWDRDGEMMVGDKSKILKVRTSLDRNFNEYGYTQYTHDSPETNQYYDPNPQAPNWEYRVIYEVWVAKSAFGFFGFGDARVNYIHAKPSKINTETLDVHVQKCPDHSWDDGATTGLIDNGDTTDSDNTDTGGDDDTGFIDTDDASTDDEHYTKECFYTDEEIEVPAATVKTWTITVDQTPSIHVRLAFNPYFVDNTYGVNSVGWEDRKEGIHKFKELVGSDHAELKLFDAAGRLTLQFKMDYISEMDGGYGTNGVWDKDGKMIVGDESDIIKVRTSLDRNFNDYGYTQYTEDSPATNENYDPNPLAPDWEYRVIYDVWVAESAFRSVGFGNVLLEYVHASPSKTGENTLYVHTEECRDDSWDDDDSDSDSSDTDSSDTDSFDTDSFDTDSFDTGDSDSNTFDTGGSDTDSSDTDSYDTDTGGSDTGDDHSDSDTGTGTGDDDADTSTSTSDTGDNDSDTITVNTDDDSHTDSGNYDSDTITGGDTGDDSDTGSGSYDSDTITGGDTGDDSDTPSGGHDSDTLTIDTGSFHIDTGSGNYDSGTMTGDTGDDSDTTGGHDDADSSAGGDTGTGQDRDTGSVDAHGDTGEGDGDTGDTSTSDSVWGDAGTVEDSGCDTCHISDIDSDTNNYGIDASETSGTNNDVYDDAYNDDIDEDTSVQGDIPGQGVAADQNGDEDSSSINCSCNTIAKETGGIATLLSMLIAFFS